MRSGSRARTSSQVALSVSHISEVICQRTAWAFSRAQSRQQTIELGFSRSSARKSISASTDSSSWPSKKGAADPVIVSGARRFCRCSSRSPKSIRFEVTPRMRAMLSARSIWRLIQ